MKINAQTTSCARVSLRVFALLGLIANKYKAFLLLFFYFYHNMYALNRKSSILHAPKDNRGLAFARIETGGICPARLLKDIASVCFCVCFFSQFSRMLCSGWLCHDLGAGFRLQHRPLFAGGRLFGLTSEAVKGQESWLGELTCVFSLAPLSGRRGLTCIPRPALVFHRARFQAFMNSSVLCFCPICRRSQQPEPFHPCHSALGGHWL